MPLLLLQNAQLSFGDRPLLDHVDLSVEAGDRLGIIGRNGAGKSSLLKVMAGFQPLDDGTCLLQNSDVRLAYVPQESSFAPNATVAQVLSQGLAELKQLHDDFVRISGQLAQQPDNVALLTQLNQLQAQLELRDGWRLQARVEEALQSLGLDGCTLVSDLSGGWKKRLAVAQGLIAKPDMLLLDEPTNHLDIDGIEALENTLRSFSGALVVISHDRRFLDNTVDALLEIDRGILRRYPGNFSAYQQRKEAELAAEAVANAHFDKLLAQEEIWIRKGIEARRTRNQGRVRRLEWLRQQRSERRERLGMAKMQLEAGKKSGALVAEFEHVYLTLDGYVIAKDVNTLIQRGDKVALIGPNGVGKTTFIRLLLGELEADSGKIRRGTQLQVAYLDQQRALLRDEDTLIDTVRQGSDYVDVMGQKKHVLSYLEDFLFPPHRARVKVGSLSGGERARLLLAKLFTKPANLLVLDEPTNDLDLETLELLEDVLQEYKGTVILVSHDRTFLDAVVTQSLCFVGDGRVVEVAGGYEDWARIRHQYQPARQAAKETIKATESIKTPPAKPAKVKLSYKEQQELDALPDRISALEKEQAELSAQLSEPAVYADMARLQAIQARLRSIESELEQAMQRWETLESKASLAMDCG